MKNDKQMLTLDQPEIYQIKVPSVLDTLWFDDDSSLHRECLK